MHAHDRTLLARLGFADPDKREPLHDLACQYLATPERARRVADLLGLAYASKAYRVEFTNTEETGVETRRVCDYQVTFERPIVKGHDQYQTSIGFVDLMYAFKIKAQKTARVEQRLNTDSATQRQRRQLPYSRHTVGTEIGVEVKIGRVGIGDVIRQIKLYRTYAGYSLGDSESIRWVVATAYPLSDLDVRSLRNERILHVLLGPGLQTFADAQSQTPTANNAEI